MKGFYTITILYMVLTHQILAQTPDVSHRPSTYSVSIEQEPEIDGEVLHDPIWQNIEPITEMTQTKPDQGKPASENTEIRIAYTSSVFYLSVVLNYLWRAVAMEYDWGLFEPDFYERREIPTRELKNYTGLYLANGDSTSFSEVNGNLVVDSKQTGSQNLVPIGNSSFLLPSVPMRYDFMNDSTGVVKSLSIRNERGDGRRPYEKIY